MDEVLAVVRLKQGDMGALEVLVRQYQDRALRAAYLVTHDRPLAEDVVQAAFVRAYEHIGQLDAERPFGPWFLRSVVNAAIKATVRGKRTVSLEGVAQREALAVFGSGSNPDTAPDARLDRAEARRVVREALETV